jgi:hypothetical protein
MLLVNPFFTHMFNPNFLHTMHIVNTMGLGLHFAILHFAIPNINFTFIIEILEMEWRRPRLMATLGAMHCLRYGSTMQFRLRPHKLNLSLN